MAVHLSDPIASLPGIGTQGVRILKTLGVVSVRDLLYYVPFRYDDFSTVKSIASLQAGDAVTVEGTIKTIKSRRSWKRKKLSLTEATIKDSTGTLSVLWFNQPYLEETLKPGTKVALAGTIENRQGLILVNPLHEPAGQQIHTGRIVPIYGLTKGLAMRRLRAAIQKALPATREFVEWLPREVQEAESLPGLSEAMTAIHFPETRDALDAAAARLKFDEVFLHQLLFADVRRERRRLKARAFSFDQDFAKDFLTRLPFILTTGQKKAAWDILQDLTKSHPMNRLLEGDVGSGKTVVAAMAIAAVAKEKGKVAYLAPTEILATQQHTTLCRLLGEDSVGLLTHTYCRLGKQDLKREDFQKKIQEQKGYCIVGTHALLGERFSLPLFDLIVIDEQHRFGVAQRHALLERQKDYAPHLLSMTATPIPRSLALTIYGDLDVSCLTEMPKGRKPIATAIVPQNQQEGMWKHLRGQIENEERIFIVCPLIDPSDRLGVQSVEETSVRLKAEAFKGLPIDVLHGKMKSDEKEKVMEDFRQGKVQVLVSTTVVEVGVDIPEATVMVVLGAERFGLAQLHQLRGRVGRGEKQSYCYLLPDTFSDRSRARLEAMVKTNNGFELAQKDLELRGPGDLFGSQQSGFPDYQFATSADEDLMQKARQLAERLMEEDSTLEAYPLVREKMQDAFEIVHLE